jgi:hypothetical protein
LKIRLFSKLRFRRNMKIVLTTISLLVLLKFVWDYRKNLKGYVSEMTLYEHPYLVTSGSVILLFVLFYLLFGFSQKLRNNDIINNNPSNVRLEPKFIVPEFVNFLLKADFGNYNGIPLNYILHPVLENHILSFSSATRLFTLHLIKNLFIENGKKFFKVSSEMNLYLDSYLTELEKKGDFDKNKFQYNKISSIIGQLFRKNVELSPEQIVLLNESHPLLVKIREIISEVKNKIEI